MALPGLEIVTSHKSLGPEQEKARKLKVFFMVSYNLDRFRSFVFQGRFFDLFEVEPELQEKLAVDDEALLRFGFRWLKFSLFGEPVVRVKKPKNT